MSTINLYIDFEIDEILFNCSKRNIQEIIEYLIKNGYILKEQIVTNQSKNMHDDLWYEAITKLLKNRHVLSKYQIDKIEEIARNIP